MPTHTETRTFTMEIEVTATATIETGGGFSDEPEWAEVLNITIDAVNGCDNDALNSAAYEEFCE
jgi:hypothetical protein